jgi:hypothetical protein
MANYIIEKGHEAPSCYFYLGKDSRIHKCKYPWQYFEVGDSIFIPAETNKAIVQNKLMSAVRKWAKHVESNTDWKTMQVDGGVRIFRVC